MAWSERIIVPSVTRRLYRIWLEHLHSHIWSLAVLDIEAYKRAGKRFDEPMDSELLAWLEANQAQLKKFSLASGKLHKLPEKMSPPSA